MRLPVNGSRRELLERFRQGESKFSAPRREKELRPAGRIAEIQRDGEELLEESLIRERCKGENSGSKGEMGSGEGPELDTASNDVDREHLDTEVVLNTDGKETSIAVAIAADVALLRLRLSNLAGSDFDEAGKTLLLSGS